MQNPWYLLLFLISAADRVDCGFPGITNDMCTAKGCCFDDTDLAGPFCFNPDLTAQELPVYQDPIRQVVCNFDDALRTSCGVGFTQAQCENKGCCYNELSAVACSYAWVPVTIQNQILNAPAEVTTQQLVPAENPPAGVLPAYGLQQPPEAIGNVNQPKIVGGIAPNAIVGVPVNTNGNGQCDINLPVNLRIDCGYDGITQVECTAKNCCWGLLPVGIAGPVCFH